MKNIGVKVRGEGGGEVKFENLWNKKSPKSTLLADNTEGLITTKQTKPRPVASELENVWSMLLKNESKNNKNSKIEKKKVLTPNH